MGGMVDAEIDAALERGRIARQGEPRARACRYDAGTGRIVVELSNDCVFAFPARLGQALEQASDEQLAQVEILGGAPGCTGRRWMPICPSWGCCGTVRDAGHHGAAG